MSTGEWKTQGRPRERDSKSLVRQSQNVPLGWRDHHKKRPSGYAKCLGITPQRQGQHQDWRATPAWVVGSSQQATTGVEKAVGRESKKFYNYQHDKSLPIQSYINSVILLASTLTTIGVALDDDDITNVLIFQLDEIRGSVADVLQAHETLTIAEVKAMLLGAEE
ncbi:hypothetical protein WOLCODRAFT_158591 [Wolfiporia cocos MD-104 SS10]|uniref:Uncharacterized protein n=1 Tax=Wolfiporia cocos (strain MD-104) TaxID=742152 RepID=A0A2H3JQX2_WOLCO|nr:hypothetical protein WOLCODRAFT_158591 [Wolfiporia cocos MD-104 SS10]